MIDETHLYKVEGEVTVEERFPDAVMPRKWLSIRHWAECQMASEEVTSVILTTPKQCRDFAARRIKPNL